MASHGDNKDFGRMIRQQRLMIPLTLHELTRKSGVSPSYLGRIERGERFPSATVLQKIARPLGFTVDELFALAGYLSPQPNTISEAQPSYSGNHLGPLCLPGIGPGATRSTAGCHRNPVHTKGYRQSR